MWGLGRTIDHEHPELHCTLIDLSAGGGPEEAPEESRLEALFREVWADDREDEVALRGSRRYVGRLTRYDEAEAAETPAFKAFKAEATYLVTGGLGALGLVVAAWMAEQGARHLVLMGRGGASASAQEKLDALRAAGTEVIVAQGDVAKADDVAAVLGSIAESMPPLRGVVHAAGIADDAIVQRLDERETPQGHGAQGSGRLEPAHADQRRGTGLLRALFVGRVTAGPAWGRELRGSERFPGRVGVASPRRRPAGVERQLGAMG